MENDRPIVKVTPSIVREERWGMGMIGDTVDLVWCRFASAAHPTVGEAMDRLQKYTSVKLPHPGEPGLSYCRTYALADGTKVVVTLNPDSFQINTVGGEHE